MSIGVAVIGAGIFPKEYHVPAVLKTESLSLKAVYSRSLKSAQALGQEAGAVDFYSDDSGAGKSYDDLLSRSDIQALIVALPILVQPEFIKKALAAGKHVLGEKPVAKDVATALDLIQFAEQKEKENKATFAVAENQRFFPDFVYAAQQVRGLGKVLGFRTRKHSLVGAGGKYFETPWRKVPEYQGGFLLDGGVHFVAGTRLLLGPDNAPIRVSAYTNLLQNHLPPVDTVDAAWTTKSGVNGTFSVSFGTTFTGDEYAVAAEKGTVSVSKGKVTVVKDGKSEEKSFADDDGGVTAEVKAWAEGLTSGKQNPEQVPAEALKDLELIEAMLRSGENNGTPIELKH